MEVNPLQNAQESPRCSDLSDTRRTGGKESGRSMSHSQQNTTKADESSSGTRAPGSEDEEHYASGFALVLIGIGVALSVFLVALDQTIVANAIPKITDEFNSVSDIGWYGSAYLFTTSALQLFFGKAYSNFSIKGTYLLAVAIFELGSLVCGLAPTSTALIIGRAVAGIGGSGIFTGALTIIAHSAPLRLRPLMVGLMGGMFGIASVCGPILGGAFTDKLTWRWCFYINLPFGAVTVVAIFFFFKPPDRPALSRIPLMERAKKIDWLGLLFFAPSVICLLLALQWGGSTYPWSNGRVVALLVVFGILFVVFAGVEYWKGEGATVPPRLITQRTVAAGSWYAFCNGAAFLIIIFYIPLWHQVIHNVSAVQSGIRLLPLVLGLVLMVIMSGGLVTLTGYYVPFMIMASIIAPIGEGLLTTFTVDATFSQWFGYQALTGMGIGMGMQQPMLAVQAALPLDDVPVATSIIIFMQTLGGAIFLAIGQSVFQTRLVSNLEVVIPQALFDPSKILKIGATDIWARVPHQILPDVLAAFNNALTKAWTVSICMSALTLLGSLSMEWKSVKKEKKKTAVSEIEKGQKL